MLLTAKFIEKPWGRDTLPAQFDASAGMRIGEIWFAHPDVPLALMIKYLFTSAPLSVQVHPNDAQARARGLPHGKDECWYILDAVPNAKLAIGTKTVLSAAQLEAAARDGSIIDHLAWHDAIAGHIFEIPSGTIHAIGAGISLIEVQQNIDLTYRLFDYNSDRELHLADGVAVARSGLYPPHLQYALAQGQVVQRPHYALTVASGAPQSLPGRGPHYVIPLSGTVSVNADSAGPGDCLLVDNPGALHLAVGTRYLMARAA